MIVRKYVIALSLVGIVAFTGCGSGPADESTAQIAVTNSYIESAVKDLFGEEVNVECLAPPGMCPGHFDISPGQVRSLRNCKLLLLFDFQSSIESSLARLKKGGLQLVSVRAPEGMCIPDTYLDVCRDVCEQLSKQFPEKADAFTARLTQIEQRQADLGAEQRDLVRQSNLSGAKILVSNHQAKFAEWLGLAPVATFIGSDTETVANIDHCLQQAAGQDVRFIVANQQEGTSLAKALGDRLGATTLVFSNFPEHVIGTQGFDSLVRANVRALLEAAAR